MSDNYALKICCVGAGYVGGPTMAVLAKHCPDIKVTVVDLNKRRVDGWNSDVLPIYEPGLKAVIKQTLGKNLFITTDVAGGITEADMIFIAVNTPTKEFGHWAGHGYDLSAYESVSRTIAQHSYASKIVVEKSTVPVLTAKRIRTVFDANKNRPDIEFEVISNPEFLAEGSAIRDLEQPDRVLIGGLRTKSGRRAVAALRAVYAAWVPEEKIITAGLWSSELAKLAANAMLSQRVSSINALSAICERSGADVTEVARVLGTDSRIGDKFLKASVGFGGSCFKKDLLGLIYLCKSFELPEVAEYWNQVLVMNEYQKLRFSKLIVQEMFGNVSRKNICLLGYAFKANTGDTRESAAIDVCRFLTAEGANIFIHDPKVPTHEIKSDFPNASTEANAYSACYEAHAVVICTEWAEYKELDWAKIYKNMAKPAFVFDGRQVVDHAALAAIGFRTYCIGRGFFRHSVITATPVTDSEFEPNPVPTTVELSRSPAAPAATSTSAGAASSKIAGAASPSHDPHAATAATASADASMVDYA